MFYILSIVAGLGMFQFQDIVTSRFGWLNCDVTVGSLRNLGLVYLYLQVDANCVNKRVRA